MEPEKDIVVENNELKNRFQIDLGDSTAYLEYELGEDAITLVHTDVPPELEGQGLGSKIVSAALEFASNKNLQVIPQCPFVAKYIQRHPEYESLVKH